MFYTVRKGIIKFEIIIFLICTLAIFYPIKPAFCQENMVSPNSVSVHNETVDRNEKQNKTTDSNRWGQIWGNNNTNNR